MMLLGETMRRFTTTVQLFSHQKQNVVANVNLKLCVMPRFGSC